LAPGLFEHVFEFGDSIGRIDIDQNDADLRTGKLADAPLGAIGRPHAETVAGFQAQRQQGPGVQIDGLSQLPPGVTQRLMTNHQRLALWITGHGLVENLANGLCQQGLVLRAAGVAELRMRTGLIHDAPSCLY
jgi:hypothetical protein